MNNEHEQRMMQLIEYTRAQNTEPYGCSIYHESGEQLVEILGNKYGPINHAETLAINKVAEKHPNIDWHSLILYTTGEPCCMCAAACCWANLQTVVYATNIPFMIELWGLESPIRAADIFKTYPKQPILLSGICELESNQLFLEHRDSFAATWNAKRWSLT